MRGGDHPSWRSPVDGVDDLSDRVPVLERVAQRTGADHDVPVAAADTLAGQVAVAFEIVEDALDGTFGDSDETADLALAKFGVAADRDDDMGVVREKRPRASVGVGRIAPWTRRLQSRVHPCIRTYILKKVNTIVRF